MLIDQVCDLLLPATDTHAVADVRLGLGYTAVQLDDGRRGLAYTYRDDLHEGCGSQQSRWHVAQQQTSRNGRSRSIWNGGLLRTLHRASSFAAPKRCTFSNAARLLIQGNSRSRQRSRSFLNVGGDPDGDLPVKPDARSPLALLSVRSRRCASGPLSPLAARGLRRPGCDVALRGSSS